MSGKETVKRSWLKRLLCCFKPAEQIQVVDTADLQSIAPPVQSVTQSVSPEPRLLEDSRLRETLRLTIRSTGEGDGKELSLEALLRNLSEADMGDTVKGPLNSVSTEMVSIEPNSVPEVESLKFKSLPSAEEVRRKPQPRVSASPLPMKPVTPAFFHGRIRIPTSRLKERRSETQDKPTL